jgi:hydrogenase-4 component B
METQMLVELFFLLCAAGIFLSLTGPALRQGTVVAWLGCLSAIVLLLAGGNVLASDEIFHRPLWALPGLTTLTVTLDRLSAVFLLVTGLVLFPAAIFAGGELGREPKQRHARAFNVLLFGLFASIVLIFIAGDAVLFLLAWEAMSVLSYLLVVHHRGRENGRASAGYLLLAMGEAGTLAAALGFLVLAMNVRSVDFATLKSAAPGLGAGARWAVFLLSFFGFGVKAGLVPVNTWLPTAYRLAPRPFVPVLAGATLNLGLYGILRINADLMPATHLGPGLVALGVGTISALLGILYATIENDLRTMLGHSSIENAGIVAAGFGAGMVFVAAGHPALASIAFVAGLYHLINHSIYKTLLF